MIPVASRTAVSFEEYLATSYRPDFEYLDGRLEAKAVVSPAHGRTQALLAIWFGTHESDWAIQVVVETRTQVRVERVRLPDVAVLGPGPLPERVLVGAPLVAVEVRSETDSDSDLKIRAADLEQLGVRNIWLLDPKSRTAEVWSGGAWQAVQQDLLSAIDSPIYLDLPWLWSKLGRQSG